MTEKASAYSNLFIPTGLENIQRGHDIHDPGNYQFLIASGYGRGRAFEYFDILEERAPVDISSVKYIITFGIPLRTYYTLNEKGTVDEEEFNRLFHIENVRSINNELIYVQENSNYIPMGFTYGKMVSHDRFMQIEDIGQRRRLMMKALVVEDPDVFSDMLILADDEAENAISEEEYQALVEEHRSECCSDLEKTTDGLTARITLEKENLVFFSASWNKWWTAFVDGEKTEYYNVNEGFVGVRVPAGTHEIKLVYKTPGFTEGCIVTVISAAVLASYLIIFRKRKKDA